MGKQNPDQPSRKRRSWPTHASWARQDAIDLAHAAAKTLVVADAKLDQAQLEIDRNNPVGAKLLIEMARRLQMEVRAGQEAIQRVLIQAASGQPDDPDDS